MASSEQKRGVFFALAACGIWGLVPLYYKAVQHVSPVEVLGHRVLWSVPFTALLITLAQDWKKLRSAIYGPRVLRTLLLSALLVATNWFVFIYAIVTGRVLLASLGYFINPLVNVVLGMLFLRERLRLVQAVAVLLAAAGTFSLTLRHGTVPWISLVLAFSFGFYGLLRKTVPIEAVNGLFVETSLLSLPALGYMAFQGINGEIAFAVMDWQTTLLLIMAGLVTSGPLVCFTSAVRRLRYSTIGILQYLAPTLQFLLAVFFYRETFDLLYLLSFILIWIGLAVFVIDSFAMQSRISRLAAKE